MNAIFLTCCKTGWLAKFVGPHAADIVSLFGSATIPTAFTARAFPSDVLADIQKRNPDCVVKFGADRR